MEEVDWDLPFEFDDGAPIEEGTYKRTARGGIQVFRKTSPYRASWDGFRDEYYDIPAHWWLYTKKGIFLGESAEATYTIRNADVSSRYLPEDWS